MLKKKASIYNEYIYYVLILFICTYERIFMKTENFNRKQEYI